MTECIICGFEGEQVRTGVIHWRDRTPEWGTGPRCIDKVACRGRCPDWPLIEGSSNPFAPVRADFHQASGPTQAARYKAWVFAHPGAVDAAPPENAVIHDLVEDEPVVVEPRPATDDPRTWW